MNKLPKGYRVTVVQDKEVRKLWFARVWYEGKFVCETSTLYTFKDEARNQAKVLAWFDARDKSNE